MVRTDMRKGTHKIIISTKDGTYMYIKKVLIMHQQMYAKIPAKVRTDISKGTHRYQQKYAQISAKIRTDTRKGRHRYRRR